MIKGIYIENFKGIGKPGIKLDLEPVTLLFGNNSAGKSTIFHAFLYAYEILVNRNYNVDRTILGGSSVDLGGFLKFVHDHDPRHIIKIEFDLDLSSAQLDKEWRISESLVGIEENEVDLSAIGTDIWGAKIGIQIAWDKSHQVPFVCKFDVDIDDEQLLTMWCKTPGDNVMSRVNYRHHIFRWPNANGPMDQSSAGVLDHLYSPFQTITDQRFWSEATEIEDGIFKDKADVITGNVRIQECTDWRAYRMIEDVDEIGTIRWIYRYDTEQQKAILDAALFYIAPSWNQQIAYGEWERVKGMNENDFSMGIEVLEQNDALPPMDRAIQLNMAPELEVETRDLIRDVISRLALGSARLLGNELRAFRHIGPLREIPPRAFQNTLSPDPARWCSGLAAWDILSVSSDEFVEKVSNWLSSNNRLDTGYSLIRKRFKELDSDGYIMQILRQENPLDDLPIALEGIEKLIESTRLTLRDDDSFIEVDPSDIAVGITQLIPVIVSALDKHSGITLIEQPELHNHPAIEVGLGDLFVETINQEHCRFILETHGEHLILRMLRRIRETTEDELPDGIKGLLPEEIAIYYIERAQEGAKAKRLRIDEMGEFIDKWPKGFFRERAEELF